MHFELDTTRCDGFGFCADAAPTLIRLDDDGQVVLLKLELTEADRTQAESAVRACPVAALRLCAAQP
ncbi:ferredoxin [Rhodoferax ferrireducens]|uniref:ferredoxin n=1 Tax=Rhodoferax ferrireducens TaxID=192843 RepID=UPI000E0DFC71|nr:ferredoxin [Rhodoferax ferrireducens]